MLSEKGTEELNASFWLDWRNTLGTVSPLTFVTKERMIAVSVAGIDGEVEAARRLFREISDTRRVSALRKALKFLKNTNAVPWNDLYVATTTAGREYSGILAGIAGEDYMMRVTGARQEWIAIGDAGDLPETASRGDEIQVTAKRF
jgi:cell filamentation protein